jgi:hypothetical protein
LAKPNEIIEFLRDLRYDDDMINGNEKRIKRNELIDSAIRLVSLHVEKPGKNDVNPDTGSSIVDPECPNGVCPVR